MALILAVSSVGAVAQTEELWVNSVFHSHTVEIDVARDYTESYNKFERCINGYVTKQSKSYARAAQSNLYDLVHDFDRVISRISNKKTDNKKSAVTKEERILALAQIQCNTYYRMGILE